MESPTPPERPPGNAATNIPTPNKPSISSHTTCAHRWDPVRTQVDDFSAYTARTAQVLHGKLQGRSHRAPVRDLYDLAVAGRKDPHALRTALRHIERRNLHPQRRDAAPANRPVPERGSGLPHKSDAHPRGRRSCARRRDRDDQELPGHLAREAVGKQAGASKRSTSTNAHLERLTGSDASDAGPYPVTAEQLGAPARELLRRAATNSQQIYRDERVTERVLALASEAQERARTPNPHGQTTEPAPPPPPRTGGWER